MRVFAIIALLSIIAVAAHGDESAELDGIWEHEDGSVIITIDGGIGVFTEIISGGWKTMLDRGRVKIGEVKFANIKKTGNLAWTCTETAYNAASYRIITGPSALSLSADGKTLRTSGTMVGIGAYTRMYTKKGNGTPSAS